MARRSRFTLGLGKFIDRAGGNARLVTTKVVIDVGASIVMKTPVGDPDTWERPAPPGYAGGRSRGSWLYGRGAPLQGEPGTIDESGQTATDRIVAGASTGDAADEHFITSNVPYMRELEFEGHSKQAPDGMVRLTIAQFQTMVDNAVEELP